MPAIYCRKQHPTDFYSPCSLRVTQLQAITLHSIKKRLHTIQNRNIPFAWEISTFVYSLKSRHSENMWIRMEYQSWATEVSKRTLRGYYIFTLKEISIITHSITKLGTRSSANLSTSFGAMSVLTGERLSSSGRFRKPPGWEGSRCTYTCGDTSSRCRGPCRVYVSPIQRSHSFQCIDVSLKHFWISGAPVGRLLDGVWIRERASV